MSPFRLPVSKITMLKSLAYVFAANVGRESVQGLRGHSLLNFFGAALGHETFNALQHDSKQYGDGAFDEGEFFSRILRHLDEELGLLRQGHQIALFSAYDEVQYKSESLFQGDKAECILQYRLLTEREYPGFSGFSERVTAVLNVIIPALLELRDGGGLFITRSLIVDSLRIPKIMDFAKNHIEIYGAYRHDLSFSQQVIEAMEDLLSRYSTLDPLTGGERPPEVSS